MTRPLLVTADPHLRDALLALAARADVVPEVATDVPAARAAWSAATTVLVGPDLLGPLGAGLPRRSGVVVVAPLGAAAVEAGVWRGAVDVGAERVVVLPDAAEAVVALLAAGLPATTASATGGSAPAAAGRVVGVLGGRGGAGASTVAAALAATAAREGAAVLLVDLDPLAGGLDLVLGAEQVPGPRWAELRAARGVLPPDALADALPRAHGVTVLSAAWGDVAPLPPDAVRAVLDAGRAGHDLVVLDLPRHLDEAARAAVERLDALVLMVPADVRGVAGAAQQLHALGVRGDRLPSGAAVGLVLRGPAPQGLTAAEAARATGVEVALELPADRQLAADLDRGLLPGRRATGDLAVGCAALLRRLVPGVLPERAARSGRGRAA